MNENNPFVVHENSCGFECSLFAKVNQMKAALSGFGSFS